MGKISSGDRFLELLRQGSEPHTSSLLRLILLMVIPGIMAQVSSVVMQYIDASMVGHLGSSQAASVGLVSSSIWLICGMGICICVGHYVQISQHVGAGNLTLARNLTKQSFLTASLAALLLVLFAILISDDLPGFLGGSPEICKDASDYFFYVSLSIPFFQLNLLSTGILQGVGSMKLPGFLNVLRCLLDVIFNFFLIFETSSYQLGDFNVTLWGAGLGVKGVGLGTVLAELTVSLLFVISIFGINSKLKLVSGEQFKWHRNHLIRALKLALPIGFEHSLMCFAMVVSVVIVATLGSVAVAAHSFAITAESFCYMVAYGISSSSSAMMGQTIGAQRRNLAVVLAWTITGCTVFAVTIGAVLMYVVAPTMMQLLTPDPQIQNYGVEVLRTVAWAEPLFAASIVISGILRGAGDTLIPSCLNCFCIWIVRLPLSYLLALSIGLYGVWVAMSIELCVRGSLMLIRLRNKHWLNATKKEDIVSEDL